MKRQEAIDRIRELYPPDSEFEETAAIGQEIINKAKEMCEDWTSLSTDVLSTAALLMIKREQQMIEKESQQ